VEPVPTLAGEDLVVGHLDIEQPLLVSGRLGSLRPGDEALTGGIGAVAPGMDVDQARQALEVREDPVAQDTVELAADRSAANQSDDELACHRTAMIPVDPFRGSPERHFVAKLRGCRDERSQRPGRHG
jgi:hypothetical protein